MDFGLKLTLVSIVLLVVGLTLAIASILLS